MSPGRKTITIPGVNSTLENICRYPKRKTTLPKFSRRWTAFILLCRLLTVLYSVFASRIGTAEPYWSYLRNRFVWKRYAVATTPRVLEWKTGDRIHIPWPAAVKRTYPTGNTPSFSGHLYNLVISSYQPVYMIPLKKFFKKSPTKHQISTVSRQLCLLQHCPKKKNTWTISTTLPPLEPMIPLLRMKSI